MADRKARGLTFKMPLNMTPRELKKAIDGGIESNVTVFLRSGKWRVLN